MDSDELDDYGKQKIQTSGCNNTATCISGLIIGPH